MLGDQGVYLRHLSLSEPDSVLHVSFPAVTPPAAAAVASVWEFGIAADTCYLGLVVVRTCSRKEKEESSPF